MDDFDINQIIYDALQSLCSTVKHSHTDAQTYPNISFFLYDYGEEAGADNAPVELGYYPQVDIWSKTETEADSLVEQTVSALRAAGFDDIRWQELYESDTKIYHVPIRAVYVRNLQGE